MSLIRLPTCPTCGGLIGADTTTENGYPCTCVSASADTVDEPVDPTETPTGGAASVTPSFPPKVCHKCGKDLRGHRRFKDSLGYWCKDCHRLDKARTSNTETRCPDCGRMRPIDKLVEFDGRNICSSCLKYHQQEAQRRANRMAADNLQKAHERRGLYLYLAIAALLLLIILFQQLSRLLHR